MALSYKNDQDENRLNPYNEEARNLSNQEQAATDNLDDHPVTAGDASGVSGSLSGGPKDNKANIDAAKNDEQQTPWKDKTTSGGGNDKNQKSLWKRAGKKGPIALIGTLLGLVGISIPGVPSLLPMDFAAKAENAFGNVSRGYLPHSNQTWRFRVGNTDACKKPSSISCKRATAPQKLIDRAEKDGFKIDKEKIDDGKGGKPRYLLTAITFPDGTKVKTGDAFVKHLNSDVSARSRWFGVSNPRSLAYAGRNFTEKVLNKFGLTKEKVAISGKTDKERGESFNREAKLSPETSVSAEANRTKIAEEVGSKSTAAAGKVTNGLGLACGAYSAAKITLALVKAKAAAEYVAFAFFFIKLADQIRAGDADPTTVATAMLLLTRMTSTGENAGKTATDSPGYKAMAYGDRSNLAPNVQKILLGGNTALIKADGILKGIKEVVGKKKLHAVCKVGSDDILGAALTIAMCSVSAGTGGTVIPIVGTAVGGVAGAAICTVGNIVASVLGGLIIGEIIKQLAPTVIDYLTSVDINFDISGVDAGNVITIGAGIMFATAGLTNGMKLATKDEAKTFAKFAYEADQQYDEVARYDARSTPFDATNQYSFMGQFINQTGIAKNEGNAITSVLSSVGSILSNARLSLFSTTASAANMPDPLNDDTLGECPDPELAEKNIGCDSMGQPRTVQTVGEMNMPVGPNLKYMESNEYIDEEGTVNEEKDYSKFLKYCTSQDEAIPGSSLLPIDNEDYDWPDTKCQEDNEMMANFRTYTTRTNLTDDEETQYEAVTGDAGGSGGTPTEPVPGGSLAGDDYKAECGKYGSNLKCNGQCVQFVKFRLVKHKVLPKPISLGEGGKDVVATLGRLGYAVNTTPAVNSVMSTPVGGGGYGHTAMVSQVNADGSIVIEEYNYTNELGYGTRTLSVEQIKAGRMTFAHTEVDYK